MNDLFREKNVEKLNKPEDLTERIKVASPRIWMLLVGVGVLIIGAAIWAYNAIL